MKSKRAKEEKTVPTKATASGSGATEDFDAREYFLETCQMDEDHTKRLSGGSKAFSLSGKKVLFYPACGLDWQPLREFFGQCDLFVYCDWNTKKDDFTQGIDRIESPTFRIDHEVGQQAVDALIKQIGVMNHLPWLLAEPIHDQMKHWGELVGLTLKQEKPGKEIGLLYLAANPIEAYRVLFTQKQTAPKFIFLKRPDGVPVEAWRFLAGVDGPLANVVASNPHHPSNLIIDNSPQDIDLWLGRR